MTYTLAPWLVRIESAIGKSLLREDEKGKYYARFNVDGLLRGDYASRMQGYATGINNGFMCVNDVRMLENLDLVPEEEGGNTFMVNGTMQKLSEVGAAYRDKAEPSESKEETEDKEKTMRRKRR